MSTPVASRVVCSPSVKKWVKAARSTSASIRSRRRKRRSRAGKRLTSGRRTRTNRVKRSRNSHSTSPRHQSRPAVVKAAVSAAGRARAAAASRFASG